MAPIVLAGRLWQEAIRGRHVLVFVDNDSARDAAIRGYSPSLPSALLVGELWQTMAAAAAVPWFDRVPGPSNLADGPSRLDFDAVLALGAVVRQLTSEHWRAVTAGRGAAPSAGARGTRAWG